MLQGIHAEPLAPDAVTVVDKGADLSTASARAPTGSQSIVSVLDRTDALRSLARPAVGLEIVIPALNEEQRLERTLLETRGFLADRPWRSGIVVVDNGSVDRTAEVVARVSLECDAVPISLIGCSTRGKGAAVRRGFVTSSAEIVGFMDADLATGLGALDDAMALLSTHAGAVIGSRQLEGSCVNVTESLTRRLGGRVFRRLARRVLPGISDTQCGFKFFRGDIARWIAMHSRIDGFAFDVELLYHLVSAGVTVVEIPVVWEWDDKSTFDIRRHGPTTAADIVRFRSRFGPRPPIEFTRRAHDHVRSGRR